MAKKYYAVAKGKTPGIYFTWADCKAQVENFSGAVYKGFATLLEAESYIESVLGDNAVDKTKGTRQMDIANFLKGQEESVQLDFEKMNHAEPVSDEAHLVAYVDGSYDHSQLRYAYGCVLVLPEGEVTLNGSDNHADYVSMRNVAGEIKGSEQAILWAIEHGYKRITIYYDYEGIEKWANGIWKANKIGTQRYKEFVVEQRNRIEIHFQKVAAHTGVKYNEMADKLAKEALGI
ncbi:MAG: ribonuclease H family protein [Lachnospiraceae bacterium]|nr:ribonuclease H family protein [Lachnospiraceae bacterium]